MTRPLVFIATDPADEAECTQLLAHLSPLRQAGHLDLSTSTDLPPGSDRTAALQAAIDRAEVALLLLSANLLSSDDLAPTVLPRLLDRHAANQLTLIPVLIKACPWTAVDGLARLHLFPPDRRPIWGGDAGRVDEQLTRLTAHLAETLGLPLPDALPPAPVETSSARNQAPPLLSPTQRVGYAVAGLLLGLAVNIAVNLLSAAIQQRYWADQFTAQSIWVLAAFALIGSLVGLWLSGPVMLPATPAPVEARPSAGGPQRVTSTRLRALLSFTKLRGQGIQLSDILLIGSKLDIDTRSNHDRSDH